MIAHGRHWASGEGSWAFSFLDNGHSLLNVFIILVFNNGWLLNCHDKLKNFKNILRDSYFSSLFLFLATSLDVMQSIGNSAPNILATLKIILHSIKHHNTT